ncbi:MAG: MmcQ/YjbR family DNA-binding protein, partial [Chloroflexota bacterium]
MRELCLALPETAELLSHGTPSFGIVGRRQFATYWNNHHADGRLALWCAAPPGAQGALVAAKPDHYFVPPYVGYRGWVGLHLNPGLAWDDIAAAVEDAYLTVAPEKLIRAH